MTDSIPDVERKSLDATIEDIGDSPDKPFGGFTAIASTPSLDRDGDRLASDEWITPLPDHITIDSDHGMSVGTTIGSARPYFNEDGQLMIDASFSSIERAQEVRTLIREGHVRTVSVAFLTDRSKKDGTPRRELLNVGVVAIPSNRDAVILDAKGGTDSVSDAAVKFLQSVEAAAKAGTSAGSGDGALVQAIHDAASHLGASCIVVESVVEDQGDVSGEAEGANKSADDASVKALEGDGTTPAQMLAGIDAVLDEVIDMTCRVDRASLPVEVAQALDMLLGVGETIDCLMEALGVYDPDCADDMMKGINLNVVPQFSLEQFKAALAVLTSDIEADAGEPQGNSPADSPVENAAAATDVVPAPADETAEEAAESEVADSAARARRLAMSIFASEVLSD